MYQIFDYRNYANLQRGHIQTSILNDVIYFKKKERKSLDTTILNLKLAQHKYCYSFVQPMVKFCEVIAKWVYFFFF